jgi:hypothetical protein
MLHDPDTRAGHSPAVNHIVRDDRTIGHVSSVKDYAGHEGLGRFNSLSTSSGRKT